MCAKCYKCFLVFVLMVLFAAACNKSAETGNQGISVSSLTMTPAAEPTETPAPTVTPLPAREAMLASFRYDECKIIDCEEYYFEVLSFVERSEGGYAIEAVFENRHSFALDIGIYELRINFLKAPAPSGFNEKKKTIEAGERVKVEFLISEYFPAQLGITKLEDFQSASFQLSITEKDYDGTGYYVYDYIMFYPFGRERLLPYEHMLEEDDVVLVEREDVKLYVTDIFFEENEPCDVYFYWENNTESPLYYAFQNESVNGYACDSFWWSEVSLEPGMCGYDFFSFRASDLEECGITSVTELEFDAKLYYDAGLWQWTDLVKDTFCIYPSGQEAAQKQERKPQDTDIPVLDTDEYKIVITEFLYEESKYSKKEMEGKLKVYLENKTDHRVQFMVNEAKFNGEEYIDKFNNRDVSPGKSLYWELSWDDRARKIVDFLNLDSLELTVQIINMDDEKQSVVLEETFAVIP